MRMFDVQTAGELFKLFAFYNCLTSLTRAECGIPSTLCWKIPNISGSIEFFAL